MANKFYWTPDFTQAITSFDVYRSIDKGISLPLLVNIPFNVNGANYDKQKKQFFYEDAGGQPGYIYKVVTNGASIDPFFIIAPANEPSLCTVVGYVRDAAGYVDDSITVHVEAFGTTGERWAKNPTGLVAQNSLSLGIASRRLIVHPNEYGIWQISLIRGIYAFVSIPALEFRWAFEVPNVEGPVNIRDIPQLRGQALALFPEMVGDRNVLPES